MDIFNEDDTIDKSGIFNITGVLHLSSKNFSCNSIPDLPYKLYHANGLILSNLSLLLCGIQNVTRYPNPAVVDCFMLVKDTWAKTFSYPTSADGLSIVQIIFFFGALNLNMKHIPEL